MQVMPANLRTYTARSRAYVGPRGPWLEHLVEDECVSMEDAISLLAPWELLPVVDGVHGHIATIIKLNKEVHVAMYRRYRNKAQVSARRLRLFLKSLLDKEVFLVTKLGPNEDARFVERLGFQPIGGTIDGVFRHYILNDLTLPGNRHAQV